MFKPRIFFISTDTHSRLIIEAKILGEEYTTTSAVYVSRFFYKEDSI